MVGMMASKRAPAGHWLCVQLTRCVDCPPFTTLAWKAEGYRVKFHEFDGPHTVSYSAGGSPAFLPRCAHACSAHVCPKCCKPACCSPGLLRTACVDGRSNNQLLRHCRCPPPLLGKRWPG